MAEIVKTFIDFSDMAGTIAFTASSGSDYLALDNADQRVSLVIRNSNESQSASVTIKAGDGALSSRGDITVTAGAGASVIVPMSRMESARVKVLSGNNKGKVLLDSSVESGGSLASVLLAVVSVA